MTTAISGFDLKALPQLPVQDYFKGLYMPMGIFWLIDVRNGLRVRLIHMQTLYWAFPPKAVCINP